MCKDRTLITVVQSSLAAALLAGLGFAALDNGAVTSASAQSVQVVPARFAATPPAVAATGMEAKTAAVSFVRSLSRGDANAVWQYATEEEQEAFETESDTLQAFIDAYPPLAFATQTQIESVAGDGDTQTVAVAVTDTHGLQWLAELGMWKDDAGAWKVVTCDIAPAPGQLA